MARLYLDAALALALAPRGCAKGAKKLGGNRASESATGSVGGVQECVQEWKRKGCESRLRPAHPLRLTRQLFTYLAKLAFSAACSRVRRVASYTKGQCSR